jgi:hypothetical protein
MSEDQNHTVEMPALGASGATSIMPNGYFAKLLEHPQSVPASTKSSAPKEQPSPGNLPDRG